VVHRDFKPENVLVGGDGRVLVTDFGLARVLAGGDEEPGTIAGTLAYMAPEQLRGEEVDARADQFAFCVTLYEGLVGERPFQGKLQVELLASIDAQALPDVALARVPSHVRRVLRRGLSRAPADRFPSMHALLVELSRDPAARLRLAVVAALGVSAVVAAVLATVFTLRNEGARCQAGGRAKLDLVWNPTRREAVRDVFLASKLPYAEDAWTRVASRLDVATERWAAMHVEACDATHARAEQSPELLDLRVACLDDRLREVRTLVDVLSHADPVVVKNAVVAVEALTPLDRCADALALRAVAPPPPELAEKVAAIRDDLAQAKALRDAGRERESLGLAREASRKSDALGYTPLAAEALLCVGAAEADLREGDAGASRGSPSLSKSEFGSATLRTTIPDGCPPPLCGVRSGTPRAAHAAYGRFRDFPPGARVAATSTTSHRFAGRNNLGSWSPFSGRPSSRLSCPSVCMTCSSTCLTSYAVFATQTARATAAPSTIDPVRASSTHSAPCSPRASVM
jgi:hypothetical protein